MSLSFLTPNRTVLLINDESLDLYVSSSKAVVFIKSVPWATENFLTIVTQTIAQECGRRPILILNDMVEQHYRKEKIIKSGVGQLDRANIVKRKLNVVFPNYSVRAAYPLKEKIKKTVSQLPADIYIFVAVPDTTQFTQTLDVTKKSLSSLAGLCLLPVESSDMVKVLNAKVSQNKDSVWSIFVGQHRSGGLRQVVTKNGELALTRMTPIVDTDKDAKQWADEVHKEIQATMSYLSRFGYAPEEGINAVAIANDEAGDILKSLVADEIDLSAMTVTEAARLLNISIGSQEDERFADVLHVAWVGKKSKFILPMKAAEVDKVSRPRQIAMLVSLGLFGVAAFLGYQLVNEYQILSESHSEIDDAKRRMAQLEVQHKREIDRKNEVGFDVELVQNSIKVLNQFELQQIKSVNFFGGVGQALGPDFRVDQISVKRNADGAPKGVLARRLGLNQGQNTTPLYTSSMKMTYPGATDVVKGNQEVRDLRERLEEALPGHKARVTKLLKDYGFERSIVVEAKDLNTKDITQDFVAEISIDGPPIEKEGGTK